MSLASSYSAVKRLPVCEKTRRYILDCFLQQNYLRTDIPILQPADIAFDLSGEKARSELFLLEAASQQQQVLRYDLTLPLCLDLIERQANLLERQSYLCAGTVFRKRMAGDERPSEFYQISVETIGKQDSVIEDAECLSSAIFLLEKLGLKRDQMQITLSDFILLEAILEQVEIAPYRKKRLLNNLWNPSKFFDLLQVYSQKSEQKTTAVSSVFAKMDQKDVGILLEEMLQKANFQHVGLRSLEDISERFFRQSQESSEPSISANLVQLHRDIMDMSCSLDRVSDFLYKKACEIGIRIDKPLAYFEKRLSLLQQKNVNPQNLKFSPNIRRKMEYYSGLVFEIDKANQKGMQALAGGGRYDRLFTALGCKQKVEAIGCEFRPDLISLRLKA